MKKQLLVAACVAFALSLAQIYAQNAPGPKGKGPGGPAIQKECPQPDCPVGGQGPRGHGWGQGGPGKGQGKCDGTGQGLGLQKRFRHGPGQGNCDGTGPKRDGTGPNCPRQNEI